MSRPYEQLQQEEQEVAVLGDFSRVLSSHSVGSKHLKPPSSFAAKDAQNLSTEFNSDLPEISVVEAMPTRKHPSEKQQKQVPNSRKNGVLERPNDRLRVPSPKLHEKQCEKNDGWMESELRGLFSLLEVLEERQKSIQQGFSEAAENLREQLLIRKKRNKNMNIQLVRMRRELTDRRRELASVTKLLQTSSNTKQPFYHTQQLIAPFINQDRSFRSRDRQEEASPSATPIGSKEKYKPTLIPQLPSFKNRIGSNKLLTRYY